VSRPIRVDMNRDPDRILCQQVEVWQNGEILTASWGSEAVQCGAPYLLFADEALGVTGYVEVDLRDDASPVFRSDRRGIVLDRRHGPVEILPTPTASPEAREILRQKRAGEIP
jgi:hypothetical protein